MLLQTMAVTKEEVHQYLAEGLKLKEQGTKAFKDGKFEEALKHYTKVFLWVNGLHNPGLDAMMGDMPDVKKPDPVDASVVQQITDCKITTVE